MSVVVFLGGRDVVRGICTQPLSSYIEENRSARLYNKNRRILEKLI